MEDYQPSSRAKSGREDQGIWNLVGHFSLIDRIHKLLQEISDVSNAISGLNDFGGGNVSKAYQLIYAELADLEIWCYERLAKIHSTPSEEIAYLPDPYGAGDNDSTWERFAFRYVPELAGDVEPVLVR